MSSRRHDQLQATLKRALQDVLAHGLQDPRARGMITVTELRLADDLKTATVMVSVLPEKQQDLTMHALRSAAVHLRRKVGDAVAMQAVPQLLFKLDTTLKQQAEVFGAIAKATAEREEKARAAAAGDADPAADPPGRDDAPEGHRA